MIQSRSIIKTNLKRNIKTALTFLSRYKYYVHLNNQQPINEEEHHEIEKECLMLFEIEYQISLVTMRNSNRNKWEIICYQVLLIIYFGRIMAPRIEIGQHHILPPLVQRLERRIVSLDKEREK